MSPRHTPAAPRPARSTHAVRRAARALARRLPALAASVLTGTVLAASAGLFPVTAPWSSPDRLPAEHPIPTVDWAPPATVEPAALAAPAQAPQRGPAAASPDPGGSDGAGTFTALPGAPAGSWNAGGQSGAFTWDYPMPVTGAPAGPTPALGLGYDSSRVDGLTSSTNNQATPAGDGWALYGAGEVRQTFTPCMSQGIQNSYDLCGNPGGQEFTVSFAGRSTTLVKDAATGAYRLRADDGTRVEYLTGAVNGTWDGGHWKLTDTSGTQYWFGLNRLPGWADGKEATNSADTVPVFAAAPGQPCHGPVFADTKCEQAAAWNLDYVVDVHGNTMAYYWAQDRNAYASRAGTGPVLEYVRTSRLARIDYGMRAGTELSAQAPLRVLLQYTGRCDGVDCGAGTDVPAGLSCTAGQSGCTVYSPTFYTDRRLLFARSETLLPGTGYGYVDCWTFSHSMPNPGDGTSPALWLRDAVHQGMNTTSAAGGWVTDPATVFSGQQMQNRVWAKDGLAPLNRYRLTGITAPTGAATVVSYLPADCTPASLPASPQANDRRCFPQMWAPMLPIPQPARLGWFHIYPVASVTTHAGPGGNDAPAMATRYEYLGNPAWKYAADRIVPGQAGDWVTWSGRAGWAQVRASTGDAASNPYTLTTWLRGLDGTPADPAGTPRASAATASDGTAVTDSPWLAGRELEKESHAGSGTLLGTAITVPWASAPTATSASGVQARQAGTTSVTTKIPSGAQPGTLRTTQTVNTHDARGRVTAASSAGEVGVAGDETCTTTAWAENTGKNLLALPAATAVYAGECTSAGAPAGNLLTAERTRYDSSGAAEPGTPGYTAPTRGLPTRTDTATTATGATATAWQAGPDLGYDDLGRPTSSTDTATGTPRTSTTAYTPATGVPTTLTRTNPLGWTTTETLDSMRGKPLAATDPNGATASWQYDASGRPTGYWDPLRPKDANPQPTVAAQYMTSATTPSWTKTTAVTATGQATVAYTIRDGLGRERQTQRMSPGGGAILTDALYDSRGAKSQANYDYWTLAAPDGTLKLPALAVPSSTKYAYDDAARLTRVTAVAEENRELWRTTIGYTGADTTTVTSPTRAETTRVNTAGKTESRALFHGTGTSDPADTSSWAYDPLGRLTGMADPAGNTWTWAYDPAGRQTRATDPDTGTTTTAYDAAGRTATVTDATGTTTAYAYDTLDRVTEVTATPAGGTARVIEDRTWDTARKGSPATATRHNGTGQDQPVTTAWSGYDPAGNPGTTTVTLPAGLGAFAGEHTTTAAYTPTGDPATLALPALGGLPAETLAYGYDGLGNPTSLRTGDWDTLAGNTQYTHLGQLATFQQFDRNALNPTGTTTGRNQTYYTWDAATGRMTDHWTTNDARGTVSDLGKTTYTYDAAGRTTSRTLAWSSRPGTSTDRQCYTYDHADRLTAAWTPATADCTTTPAGTTAPALGGPAPYAQTYTYTPAGDRAQTRRYSTDGTLAATEDYTYPAAAQPGPHRLQSMTSTPTGGTPTTHTFAWDTAGRMTSLAGQALAYTPDGHLATTAGTTTLPTSPNPATASSPAPASGSGTRYYDADGTLIGTVDATGTTVTLGSTTAHATPTGTQSATRAYAFAGKTVAQRTHNGGATVLAFVLADPVGTATTLITPATGTEGATALTRYTDPYGLPRGTTTTATGNTAPATAPTGTGPATNAASTTGYSTANGYLGAPADASTGLTRLGARDYDPTTGAFTTPDPILHTDRSEGFTPYSYAWGNPIGRSDPSGLDWWGDVGDWFHDNAGTIVEVAVATVVTVAVVAVVTAAVAGCAATVVCAVGVAIAAGAVGAAAGYAAGTATDVALGNKEAPTAEQFWTGMGQAAVGGAIGGALGGAAGTLGPRLIGAAAKAFTGGAASTAGTATRAAERAAASRQATQAIGNASAARTAAAPTSASAGTGPRATAASLCSFAGTTPVLMADGSTKPIADIRTGDQVTATDPETGEQGPRTVTHTWAHPDTLTDLAVDGEPLTTTENHPFWSVDDQRFERADQLTLGEHVRAASGTAATITTTLDSGTAHSGTAYNLTVQGTHTYHVGTHHVLVHNTCGTTKPVNLPAWRSISVDMDHVASGHMAGGTRVSSLKGLFPDSMSRSEVEKAIITAYRNSSKVSSSEERIRLRGPASGLQIDMWLNKSSRMIETAFPVKQH